MVIYNRDKKELIIPTGFGYDCSEAIASARTEGYNEGKEDGMSIVRNRFGLLHQSPHWNELNNGIGEYYPSGNIEAWSGANIDYNNVYNDGVREGIRSASTVDLDVHIRFKMSSGGFLWSAPYSLRLNDIPIDCDFIVDDPFIDRFYNNYHFLANIDTSSINSINKIELYTFWDAWAPLDEQAEFTIDINGQPTTIINSVAVPTGEVYPPTYSGYNFTWNIEPIGITSYGEGWDDGYESGYTDGISAERPTSEAVFTENGVYTTSGGWNQVIVNVHESAATVNLQEKNIVIDNFYHYVGDDEIVVTPDAGYDGLSAVTISAVTTDEIAEVINNNLVVTEGLIDNSFAEAGSAITITENGIYTPSGGTLAKANEIYQFPSATGTNSVALHWNVPHHFNRIEVNVSVPHWNNYCSGSFSTSAIKVWSSADEQQICFFEGLMPVNTFDKLTVDGVSLLGYCTEGYTMQPGQHKFVLDMDGMRDDEGWTNSFVPTQTFPNLTGSITYNFYRKIK